MMYMESLGANRMRLGIVLLPSIPMSQILELAIAAESRGVQFLGLGDSQILWRDPYITLALAASQTNSIQLGPFVTNVQTRHPSVTANTMSTLNELAPNRFFLGLGYGDSALKTIGLKKSTRPELKQSVDMMRGIWAGESIDIGGVSAKAWTRWENPQIWWAADGPLSCEQAGAEAEMVIANGLMVKSHMEYMRSSIHKGALDAGRSRVPTVAFHTGIIIDDDGLQARKAARPYLVRTLCHELETWLPGWSSAQRAEFVQKYEYMDHLKESNKMAEFVPDELIDFKVIAGTPEFCAERIQWAADQGNELISMVILGDIAKNVRYLLERVLPILGIAPRV